MLYNVKHRELNQWAKARQPFSKLNDDQELDNVCFILFSLDRSCYSFINGQRLFSISTQPKAVFFPFPTRQQLFITSPRLFFHLFPGSSYFSSLRRTAVIYFSQKTTVFNFYSDNSCYFFLHG